VWKLQLGDFLSSLGTEMTVVEDVRLVGNSIEIVKKRVRVLAYEDTASGSIETTSCPS